MFLLSLIESIFLSSPAVDLLYLFPTFSNCNQSLCCFQPGSWNEFPFFFPLHDSHSNILTGHFPPSTCLSLFLLLNLPYLINPSTTTHHVNLFLSIIQAPIPPFTTRPFRNTHLLARGGTVTRAECCVPFSPALPG